MAHCSPGAGSQSQLNLSTLSLSPSERREAPGSCGSMKSPQIQGSNRRAAILMQYEQRLKAAEQELEEERQQSQRREEKALLEYELQV